MKKYRVSFLADVYMDVLAEDTRAAQEAVNEAVKGLADSSTGGIYMQSDPVLGKIDAVYPRRSPFSNSLTVSIEDITEQEVTG